ncbi:MAG TPA: glycosyltransferase family 2 protein [Candidatus Limnocylindrales bacterium]|nr:glycosyltransferase family 2 protein [Candidatus Limnocylindrales bacterium]
MEKVSATVICHNEEVNIRACLESLRWADEIIVVDAGSSDGTVAIAREYTDRVHTNPWPGHKEQKNFAVDRAAGPWIFSLDADERVSPELAARIREVVENPRHDGYRFPRDNYFLGHRMRHGGWYPDYVLRLFRREKGRFTGINPHDYVAIDGGNVGIIPLPITHITYRSFSQYVRKQLSYSEIGAAEMEKRRRDGRIPGGGRFLSGFLFKFLETYLWKGGFLDGWPGFVASMGGAYAKMGRLVIYRERVDRREAPVP